MRKVKNTSTQALVAEYTYSGLGHRIGWHYDVDADGTVEDTSDDPWIRFVYDERWRIVGTFRASDSSPKEQFVYHNAGADGRGGSSYIDTVICRDRDANVNWADAADGTLEERIYYCHNWRGDVSVLIEDDADMVEWVKYSPYGIPFGLPKGDQDSDGDLDSTDVTAIQNWGANPYDVRADLDLDGDVDSTDATLASNASPITLGWGNLSEDPDSGAGNRKGYAGYEFDSALDGNAAVYHVRNRVKIAALGRWTRRDPLGYVDGANLYAYVRSNPLAYTDPQGAASQPPVRHFRCPCNCTVPGGPYAGEYRASFRAYFNDCPTWAGTLCCLFACTIFCQCVAETGFPVMCEIGAESIFQLCIASCELYF